MQILLLELLDLRRCHFAAVGGEFAVGLRTDGNHIRIGRGGQQNGKQFFFEYREMALQVFEPGRGFGSEVVGEIAEGLGCIASYGLWSDAFARWENGNSETLGIAAEICRDLGVVEAQGSLTMRCSVFSRFFRDANGRFFHFLGGSKNFLGAIS